MKNLINIRVLQHDTNDQIRIGMAYPITDLDKEEKKMNALENKIETLQKEFDEL